MLCTVIKVSKSSKIRLKNTKAYRAINFQELDYYIENYKDINVIIIEGASEDDFESAKKCREATVTKVLAYSESEVSDDLKTKYKEIGIEYLVGLVNLQDYIEDTLNIEVATHRRVRDTKVIEIAEVDGESSKSSSDSGMDLFNDTTEKEEAKEKDADEARRKYQEELEESLRAIRENTEIVSEESEEDEDNNISVTITSKDDLVKDIDESLLFEEETQQEEENIRIANEELEKIIRDKDIEIERLDKQLSITLEKLANLSKIREVIEREKKDIENKLNGIMIDDDVTEVIIGALDRSGYEEKIRGLELEITDLNLKLLDIDGLQARIDNLDTIISKKEQEELKLKEEIIRLSNNTELDNLKAKIETEVASRLTLSDLLNSVLLKLNNTKESLNNKTIEYNNAMNELRKLQDSYSEVEDRDRKLLSERDRLQKELINSKKIYESRINSLAADNKNKATSYSLLQLEKGDVERRLQEMSNNYELIQEKFTDMNGKFTKAQQLLAEQKKIIDQYKDIDISTLQDSTSILEKTNSSMVIELGRYKQKIADAESRLVAQNTVIESLKKQNDSLRQTTKSVQSGALPTASEELNIRCDYSGSAKLIGIMGSGSIGITTTAISLCHKLRGRVLFIDMDIVSPKADGYLKKNPMIKGLDGFTERASSMYQTGLGTLLYKDADYFIDHESLLVQSAVRTRDGYILDYISGLYTKAPLLRYMTVDFGKFLSYFGGKYDYIVCDLGRVGGSEIQNALIRMVSSIAYKTIVIALHNRGDMRSVKLRLDSEKVKADNTIWMLNMSKNAAMDDIMRRCIGQQPFVIMPKKMDIYGEDITFDKVPILKDKLSELCSKILQG